MRNGRPRSIGRLLAPAVLIAVAACSGTPVPDSPEPTASEGEPSPSGSASPTASPPRTLSSFAPDEEWRPVLELISGPGGTDEGAFDVESRYRIRFDCVGEGSIAVRVGSRVRARRECADEAVPEPEVVRGQAGGRLRARVTSQGQADWIVRFEVPR